MDSLSSTESWGAGPANLSPMRFTDDSIISVPVLSPSESSEEQCQPAPGTVDRAIKRPSFFHHKSTSRSASRKAGEGFTMRRMSRRDYLARYAKDDAGKYIGTQDPADDCILRGEDLVKYRTHGAVGPWKNETSEVMAEKTATEPDPTTADGRGGSKSRSKFGKLFKALNSSKAGGDVVIH